MREPLTGPADDTWLIQQSQHGSRDAFNQLQVKYQALAFRTALKFLGHAQDAEDITQDAFLRAYQRIKTFRGDSSFPTWLLTIVRNLCLNKRRWWARYRKLFAGPREEMMTTTTKHGEHVVMEVAETATLAQGLIRTEQRQQLQAAIAQLEEPSRSMVVAHYFRGLSDEQIAQEMRCPVGTVKSRLNRATPRLKQLVQRMSR
jgi:RNA polymerase sigma-70 factor (ECF subfamily)